MRPHKTRLFLPRARAAHSHKKFTLLDSNKRLSKAARYRSKQNIVAVANSNKHVTLETRSRRRSLSCVCVCNAKSGKRSRRRRRYKSGSPVYKINVPLFLIDERNKRKTVWRARTGSVKEAAGRLYRHIYTTRRRGKRKLSAARKKSNKEAGGEGGR